ncbi:unnamed protein product [Meganyctiphanes norvegica]|uniref:NADH-cytochrome b5 reductase n=1 Tax=Meganyctiphanes norvegica TaxID=48144 RepID=A0AAV2QEQ3_MEGNR
MDLAVPASSYIPVPMGYHTCLRLPGTDLARPYTPIASSFVPMALQEDHGKKLSFLIKVYQSGEFTSSLAKLAVGDPLEVSIPDGQFKHHSGESVTSEPECILLCLAAGTGITPMINLMLHQLYLNRKVVLLWFNKTEKDIAWKEELSRLQRSHKNLFKVVNVLSAANMFWEGYRGRITSDILMKELPPIGNSFTPNTQSFVCICGPSDFNHLAQRLVTELGYREENVQIFQG